MQVNRKPTILIILGGKSLPNQVRNWKLLTSIYSRPCGNEALHDLQSENLSPPPVSSILKTCNLWNVWPSSSFPESYNWPSFKSKISNLDLISFILAFCSLLLPMSNLQPLVNSAKNIQAISLDPTAFGCLRPLLPWFFPDFFSDVQLYCVLNNCHRSIVLFVLKFTNDQHCRDAMAPTNNMKRLSYNDRARPTSDRALYGRTQARLISISPCASLNNQRKRQ